MIRPYNPLYRQALGAAHNAYSRVEVWRSGSLVQELSLTSSPTISSLANVARGAPVFLKGNVRATLASRVTRVLTMDVPDWLFPWSATDLLAPYGNELRAYRGIRYGSGEVDEFPIFRGPITDATPSGGGLVSVTAGDRAWQVVKSGFSAPTVANVGSLVTTEYRRLVLDAVPDATFGTFDAITTTVPALSYDYDRGAALDGLATAAGAYWYPLADGSFVLRLVPWSIPIAGGKLLLTNQAGGSLLSARPKRTSGSVYSRITVSNEPTDGAPPFHATVDDLDPTSPTYSLGPYGVQALQFRITGAATQASCRTAASALLARSKSLTQSWSLVITPDGSIELGDALDVEYVDTSGILRPAVQLVAGFTIPLEVDGTMSVDARDPLPEDQAL
jgi:hypothetical protein